MKSTSVSPFAALALYLFLASNEQSCHQFTAESFQVSSRATLFGNNLAQDPHSGYRYRSSSSSPNQPQQHQHQHQHQHSLSRIRLQIANPKTDSQQAAETFNDTALSTSESLERAWALESAEESETNAKSLNLLSADFLGPLFSVAFVMCFLFYTLLNSSGISDSFAGMDFNAKIDVLSRISWIPRELSEAKVVVAVIMAFSGFAQALTGFGFAVVAVGAMSSMPWLLHSELYDVITPVAATLGALVGFILLIPYAFAEGPPTEEEPGLDWGEILPLLIPCTVLTPLGIQLNSMVDPILATRILAGLIMAFVGYKLVPTIQDALGSGDDVIETEAEAMVVPAAADEGAPEFLQSKTAAILLGSAAGIFGGAFDVQGPPLCVYGDAKGWSPARFRNNVLAVVCLNSALVVGIDLYEGALSNFYYSFFCVTSLPGVLLGVAAGQYASKRIDPVLFKNLVLVMCLGLGVQLLRVS